MTEDNQRRERSPKTSKKGRAPAKRERAPQGEIGELRAQLRATQQRLEQAEQELRDLAAERSRLAAELAMIRSSISFKLATRYATLRNNSPAVARVHRTLKRLIGRKPAAARRPADLVRQAQRLDELKRFLREHADKPLVLVWAAVKYVESEGQRSVRLAQSFLQSGRVVLYVYWNWSDEDRDLFGEVAPGLFATSRSDLLACGSEALKAAANRESKVALFEIPDPAAMPLVAEANSRGFTTVYDVLDDWEEFHKLGEAVWFEKGAELFYLRNCAASFAVTQALVEKFPQFGVGLLPNGFNPDKLTDQPPLELERRKTTLGYFGYLTRAWFDWDLLIATARARPDFMFHIVGYGMPDDLELPANIKYHGKVQPTRLSAFVKSWDVCLIPFKEGALAKSADPIKLYEYLYFRRPTVVTGLPHLSTFPYVVTCEGTAEAFQSAIAEAKRLRLEEGRVAGFLDDKTWLKRAESLLAKVESAR